MQFNDMPDDSAARLDGVESLFEAKIDATGQPRHGYAGDMVSKRLIVAIFEHRLPPGARLTEIQLAETFGVSRTVARQAMAQLAETGIICKTPNQGYSVAAPTRHEARMMMDVREMLEPAMLRSIAKKRSEAGLQLLRDHIAAEAAARARGDRSTLVRLTGEFHLKLAELSENPWLIRYIMQLQTLTCLAILVHAERETGCPRDEHSQIVEAIAAQDEEAAIAQMKHHLDHIRLELQLDRTVPERDLASAFRWLRGQGE